MRMCECGVCLAALVLGFPLSRWNSKRDQKDHLVTSLTDERRRRRTVSDLFKAPDSPTVLEIEFDPASLWNGPSNTGHTQEVNDLVSGTGVSDKQPSLLSPSQSSTQIPQAWILFAHTITSSLSR
ncbi:hypothetical protein G5I_02648 [Acromyrmex echinatior]|uniref:Secreted protein n=1 Tax=Acromyrmex echinatior TaxID=103372 RepID=F4WAV5_ACREC|nr:hypothetical protein G5I_02648 [Acromyrmex echinatior]